VAHPCSVPPPPRHKPRVPILDASLIAVRVGDRRPRLVLISTPQSTIQRHNLGALDVVSEDAPYFFPQKSGEELIQESGT
jgi:hypothetical protein